VKIFETSVKGGHWVCFDEFNRMTISELEEIGNWMANEDNRAPWFITMNPGYGGRTAIPDTINTGNII